MATPSLAMIPSAYADSKVYSVLPNNGDGDFTFNRDSSATRVGQNGLIQTVGYFGSELIVNGDFSNGGANWSYNVNHWSFSSGTADCNGTQTSLSYLNQSGAIVSGKVYKVTYEVTSITAGEIIVFVGDVSGVARTTAGVYTENITAASTNFWLRASSNFVGSIDNVSVQEVLGDQPRLNYDISNGVVQSCPSLLLEPASTNLVTFSEDLTSWTQNNVTHINNFATSPDGQQNAIKLVESSGTSTQYRAYKTISASTAIHTFSCYVKRISGDRTAYIDLGAVTAFFNFNTKSIYSAFGTASFEDVGNEWYRIQLSHNTASATSVVFLGFGNGNAETYTTTGGAEILFYGLQIEVQSYATSYIPTAGTTITRAAETCNGAGNAATFNSTEGVLYLDFASLNNAGNYRLISLSDGTTSNRLFIGFRLDTGYIYYFVIVAGSTQASNITTITAIDFTKVAVKWKANDFALWVDGVEISSDTSGISFPADTLNTIQMNEGDGAGFEFYGKVKDLRVYNEALTDAQLQTLTTL